MDLLEAGCPTPVGVQVVSATGEPIPVRGRVTHPVRIGQARVDHPLVVVSTLIAPVILGIDFLQAHGLVLDSTTAKQDEEHLRLVFQRLTDAGLTLRGKKCRIGLSRVAYLGHIFSAQDMEPDPQKISAVKD